MRWWLRAVAAAVWPACAVLAGVTTFQTVIKWARWNQVNPRELIAIAIIAAIAVYGRRAKRGLSKRRQARRFGTTRPTRP